MQKTSFKFEVLIHDDHSTDGTAEIIHEYSAQYPDIIKPFLRLKINIVKGSQLGLKYGICHEVYGYLGDDYWTDPNKLQKHIGFDG